MLSSFRASSSSQDAIYQSPVRTCAPPGPCRAYGGPCTPNQSANSWLCLEISGSSSAQDPAVVFVPQADYEHLIRIASQYANLCQNLINGGVNEATIQLLSDNVSPPQQPQASEDLSVQAPAQTHHVEVNSSHGSDTAPDVSSHAHLTHHGNHAFNHYHGQSQDPEDWADSPSEDASLSADIPGNVPRESSNSTTGQDNGHSRLRHERLATRSVLLTNLPDETTHADITSVIRGGLLLDIYLRRKDGTASVSFLSSHDAQAFYDHVRKNDLYINNKRVEVKWNDRQYVLPGHLSQKIGSGATRNFVIRRCDSNHTEASIREDLEHIHNLVVVKINFNAGDCYISTNSVANAMFARTCMMSRLKYKGSRIEWDVDECAQSLDRMPVHHHRRAAAPSAPTKQPLNPMANRFQLLHLDD